MKIKILIGLLLVAAVTTTAQAPARERVATITLYYPGGQTENKYFRESTFGTEYVENRAAPCITFKEGDVVTTFCGTFKITIKSKP